jgi:hypothetical protein
VFVPIVFLSGLSAFESWFKGPAGVLPVVLVLSSAVWAGYAVQRSWPSAKREGQWIWLLPVFLFCLSFTWDIHSLSLKIALKEFFNVNTGEGSNEIGLGLILVTLPVCSCCCYSLGVKLGGLGKNSL